MSILFNNGGVGTNPTNEYLPYNNNGSFADSPFWYKVAANTIISRNLLNNNDEGLLLDFNSQLFYLGDYNVNTKGTALFVDNNTGYIYTFSDGNLNGIEIANTHTTLGDVGNNYNGCIFKVDDQNKYIYTALQGDAQGLKVFFDGLTSYEYYLGDFDNVHNGSYIGVLDTIQTVELNGYQQIHLYSTNIYSQTNNLKFQEITAGSLIYTTAGGSSGKHLKIFVNGVGYKIALNNL